MSAEPQSEPYRRPGHLRVQEPVRHQVEMRLCDLDALVPADHRARMVWEFVRSLDLSALYSEIRTVQGGEGRPPVDPAILLSLWLYATLDGVGSARSLDRHCVESIPYQWLCGGVSVNYHLLSDFRSHRGDVLDELLTQSVASLLSSGLVDMQRVAQDGMRVRASAGAASFRREQTLEELLKESEAQVAALRASFEAESPQAVQQQEEAARLRAAEDRRDRLAEALRQMPAVRATKKRNPGKKKGQRPPDPSDPPDSGSPPKNRGEAREDKKRAPRVSSTDPDARVMKMANGGYNPAFNAQLVADTKTQVVLGVEMTNRGSDFGCMSPMVEQLKQRYGFVPEDYLVDGGFASLEEIEKVSTQFGIRVYAPTMKKNSANPTPASRHRKDSPRVAEWRARMDTPEAQAVYRERAATIECVNAQARNHGLGQFLVRGLKKVRAVLLLHALAQNLLATWRLAPQSA